MRYFLSAIMGLGLIAAAPAFAASQSSTTQSQGSTAANQNAGQTNPAAQDAVAQKLQQDLQQSGFKNVRVMPESFLVRADDKEGHPVMMIVNPDSITAVTQVASHEGTASNSSQPLNNNSSTPNTNTTQGNAKPAK